MLFTRYFFSEPYQENCKTVEVRGFLKNFCGDDVYQCLPKTDGTIPRSYTVDHEECNYAWFSDVCEDDPVFYQTCGHVTCEHSLIQQDPPFVCGSFACLQKKRIWWKTGQKKWRSKLYNVTIGGIENNMIRCNKKTDCVESQIDEENCPEVSHTCKFFEESVNVTNVCDGKCDCYFCEDEFQCSGKEHDFGVYCENKMTQRLNWGPRYNWPDYVPPAVICDGIKDCNNGEDEKNCPQVTSNTCLNSANLRNIHKFNRTDETVRIRDYTSAVVKLTNKNTCIVPNKLFLVCTDYRDQLNCSEVLESPLICKHNKFEAYVSKYALCKKTSLCDDSLDANCHSPTGGCLIHKHKFCDGVSDCKDSSDENVTDCREMTKEFCQRRFQRNKERNESLPIPLAWVMDGVADCIDDFDENPLNWKLCGEQLTKRYIEKHNKCHDIFFCSTNKEEYTNISSLCDGRSTACVMESDICRLSRKAPKTSDHLTRLPATDEITMGMFLPGLKDLALLFDKLKSVEIHTRDKPFGVSPFQVTIPKDKKIDCRFVYGELYVFLSCSGGCINETTSCKLNRQVKHDSCFNIPRQDTVFTLAKENYLTIASKRKNKYRSDLYPCKNNFCVTLDKVCNLVDDCGDASDEEDCQNHFKCGSKEYVPLSSVRDGSPHCNDFSDECADDKSILTSPVSVVAWLIGIPAVFLNALALVNGIYVHLTEPQTSRVRNTNMLFIILISFGDLLMGFYLLSIAILHATKKGTYCKEQFSWLVSNGCASLGVISTLGSLLSLFSMTCLSFYRLKCTATSSHNQKMSSVKYGLVIFLIISGNVLAASSIALVPLLPMLEDFFVNGMYYESVPLFIGAHSKPEFREMLEKYYSKFGDTKLSWQKIRKLVKEMFSDDYGGITEQKLHFYGNDGVCLFKYFVDKQDPQRYFVGAVLLLNLICFIVITVCYASINITVSRSNSRSKKVTKKDSKMIALQRKIAIIIATDFACWIPFIFCSLFHYLEVMDATQYYEVFSIIFLPINSAINPLLYDTAGLSNYIKRLYSIIRQKISGGPGNVSSKGGTASTAPSSSKAESNLL